MRRPKESKTAIIEDEAAELMRRAIEEGGVFSSTAHRDPILSLLASQNGR